ncbi:MAG: hypothetical protein HY825_03660 [Acidobacteria bacterium]|nr:hypothetical protein [Acidobacteriota bacterium]
MLEEFAPDPAAVLSCFVSGAYYYKKKGFSVSELKAFLKLLAGCSQEKKRIVLANLHTSLDAVARYAQAPPDDEDIPF